MIKIGENGELLISSTRMDGEEWLMRVRSIIRLIQGVNEETVNPEVIYHALSLLEDMMPDEESAKQMFKAIGR